MSSLLTPIEQVIKEFFATKPKDVDGVFNTSCMYYQHWMLQKIFGRFEFTGFLDWWDMDYFLEHLFLDGYICITYSVLGYIPLKCGFSGFNVFNHPTECNIAVPELGSFTRKIGTECSLVKISYDFHGINEQLARYAYLLASCDSAIAVNLMNTKVTMVGGVSSQKEAKELKKMYDKISMGEPAVYVSEAIADKFTYLPAKQNYIADMVQDTKRTIINEFLTEWGINNANTDKKERLVSDEVNANNEEINANIQSIIDNITEGFELANRLFNLQLKVTPRKWGERSAESLQRVSTVPRDVEHGNSSGET